MLFLQIFLQPLSQSWFFVDLPHVGFEASIDLIFLEDGLARINICSARWDVSLHFTLFACSLPEFDMGSIKATGRTALHSLHSCRVGEAQHFTHVWFTLQPFKSSFFPLQTLTLTGY